MNLFLLIPTFMKIFGENEACIESPSMNLPIQNIWDYYPICNEDYKSGGLPHFEAFKTGSFVVSDLLNDSSLIIQLNVNSEFIQAPDVKKLTYIPHFTTETNEIL